MYDYQISWQVTNSLGTEKKKDKYKFVHCLLFFSPFHMIELDHENLHLCIRLRVITSTLLSNKPSYCHFSYYVLFTPSENH